MCIIWTLSRRGPPAFEVPMLPPCTHSRSPASCAPWRAQNATGCCRRPWGAWRCWVWICLDDWGQLLGFPLSAHIHKSLVKRFLNGFCFFFQDSTLTIKIEGYGTVYPIWSVPRKHFVCGCKPLNLPQQLRPPPFFFPSSNPFTAILNQPTVQESHKCKEKKGLQKKRLSTTGPAK